MFIKEIEGASPSNPLSRPTLLEVTNFKGREL